MLILCQRSSQGSGKMDDQRSLYGRSKGTFGQDVVVAGQLACVSWHSVGSLRVGSSREEC